MILIVETPDDAAAALVALRDWAAESPELKVGARYGQRRAQAERFSEDVLAALKSFRRLRTALNKSSGADPGPSDGPSRDRSRGEGRRPHPPRAASTQRRTEYESGYTTATGYRESS